MAWRKDPTGKNSRTIFGGWKGSAAPQQPAPEAVPAAAPHPRLEPLQNLMDSVPTAIVAMALDGTIEYWNAGAERLLGITLADAVNKNLFDMIPGMRSAMTNVAASPSFNRGASQLQDCSVLLPDRAVQIDIRLAPIDTPGIGVRSLALVLEDSNLRRASENMKLRSMTDQRNSLVREVHHRIKNHLHGIIALLRLQALRGARGDPFDIAVEQLRSVALAYGIQEQSNSGKSSISLLLERAISSLGTNSGSTINFEKGSRLLDSLSLNEADSVPVALVIIELLTNAQRHGTTGKVDVKVFQSPDRVDIDIANAGRLPPAFNWDSVSGLASGLSRAKALLPERGVRLAYRQESGNVIVRLSLDIPMALSPTQI